MIMKMMITMMMNDGDNFDVYSDDNYQKPDKHHGFLVKIYSTTTWRN